jgi:hypothetical protein
MAGLFFICLYLCENNIIKFYKIMAKKNTKKVEDVVKETLVENEITVATEEPVVNEPVLSEEQVISDVVVNVTEETVEYTPQESESSIDYNQIAEETKFEFQKDYIIGDGDPSKEAEIDTLPVETMHGIDFINDVKEIITQSFDKPANIKVQVKKSVNSLTASEYKTYLRTGILPNQ